MKNKAPIAILLIVAAIGTGMTLFVNAAANRAAQSQFDIIANEATDRLERRISQHILLLHSAAAHLETSQNPLERAGFGGFIDALNLEENYPGVRGIGFALLTATGREEKAAALIRASYGINRKIWPETTTQAMRTPIVLLEPQDERNQAAIGYDMYSETIRRAAMVRAIETDKAAGSGPVQLVQEINADKQIGFLVYVPVSLNSMSVEYSGNFSKTTGFVYSPFRAGDLHTAALGARELPAVFQTVDVDAGNAVLSQSADYAAKSVKGLFRADREINVAGRMWRIHFVSTSAFSGGNWQLGTLLLGIVSLLFAAALATSVRAQITSIETANRLATVSKQASDDKDMMLQEMKHRIKNSIARVLAIARQTASGSKSVEDFSASFFSRLQSMSSAQELLTRSHYEKADLRELLDGELHQVLGDSWDKKRLSGDDIQLNARATQALGLTFHELATNALKYGDPKGIETGLAVRWFFEKVADKDVLKLEWVEPGGAQCLTEKTGFGSKLIKMNVERELGGLFDRIVDAQGLTIRLILPKHALV